MFSKQNVQVALKRVSLEYPYVPGCCIYLDGPCSSSKDGITFLTDDGEVHLTEWELMNLFNDVPNFDELAKYWFVNGKPLQVQRWQFDIMYERTIYKLLHDYLTQKKLNGTSEKQTG